MVSRIYWIEGNFNISLRNLKDNKYNSLLLTFQIGLHIDDLDVLKFIQRKLNCGHISISGSKCNYFVNDQVSLIYVILPLFNYVQLNSSKYFHYLIFEKAVNLIKNKAHLSPTLPPPAKRLGGCFASSSTFSKKKKN